MLFSAVLLLCSLHNVVAQRKDADLMSFVTVGGSPFPFCFIYIPRGSALNKMLMLICNSL